MGNFFSKFTANFYSTSSNKRSDSAVSVKNTQVATTLTFGKKKDYDPADFMFSKIVNGTSVKLPKSIPNGMPINIEDCESSSIFIYDVTAQVMVDSCKSCFIFIGPSEGSIFIRDCKDCIIVCASQQFRMRDCENIKLSMYVSSQPIIETSTLIDIGSFWYNYPELKNQFAKANLPIIKNEWWNIYDFNDKTGKNWKVMNHREKFTDSYSSPSSEVLEICKVDLSMETCIIPWILGDNPRPYSNSCVVFTNHSQIMNDLIQMMPQDYCFPHIKSFSDLSIVNTPILEKYKLEIPFDLAGDCIFIEINGECVDQLDNTYFKTLLPINSYKVFTNQDEVKMLMQTLFDETILII